MRVSRNEFAMAVTIVVCRSRSALADPPIQERREPAGALDKVAKHPPSELDPGVRSEPPVINAHADADATAANAVALQHPAKRHRANQAPRAQQAVIGNPSDRNRETPRVRL
jgi:hypothetical protein